MHHLSSSAHSGKRDPVFPITQMSAGVFLFLGLRKGWREGPFDDL